MELSPVLRAALERVPDEWTWTMTARLPDKGTLFDLLARHLIESLPEEHPYIRRTERGRLALGALPNDCPLATSTEKG